LPLAPQSLLWVVASTITAVGVLGFNKRTGSSLFMFEFDPSSHLGLLQLCNQNFAGYDGVL
jgi:hypothetical protein